MALKMTKQVFALVMVSTIFYLTTCQDLEVVFTFTQPEEQSIGQFVGSVSTNPIFIAAARDTNLRYSISSNKNGDLFSIDSTTGNVTFAAIVDREKVCPMNNVCELTFSVPVTGSNFFRNARIKVVITDINDNSPTFKDTALEVHISEAVPISSSFSISAATDLDMSPEFGVNSYSIEPDSDTFKITVTQNQLGMSQVYLVTKQELDREAKDTYTLLVVARDGGKPPRNGSMTVKVVVDDYNDNSPVFTKTVYTATFNETSGAGYSVLTVTATDLDIGNNGKVTYSFSPVQPLNPVDIKDKVDINGTSGLVFLKQRLASGDYQILVDAKDSGYPQGMNQTLLKLTVLDNENSPPMVSINPVPVNDLLPGWVPEVIASIGTVVAVVMVEDPDSGQNGNVSCSSLEPHFVLQNLPPKSYTLALAGPLDREVNPSFNVSVVCRDSGTPSLTGSASIEIYVWDINDNAPVFVMSNYTASIVENNMKGDPVLVVNALDPDNGENARIEYRIIEDNGNFEITQNTGVIKANRVFDYEEASKYEFKILAVDNGVPRLTGTTNVVVTIKDINDNAPKFSQSSFNFQLYENREPGTVLGNISVTDPDTDVGGQIDLSLRPIKETDSMPPFNITKDGRILSLEKFDRETKDSHSFFILATDNGQRRLSSSAQVTVKILDENDNKPTFIFPGDQNFSAYVNIPIDADSVILRVEAQDADEGKNAALIYSLSESNASDLFRIARVSGELMANRKIIASDIGTYTLYINVSDQGNPPLSSSRFLVLVIQSEPTEAAGKSVIADQNVLIVACIICFTVIVSGVVLIAIFVLRRLDNQRKMQYASSRGNPGQRGVDDRPNYGLAITGVKDRPTNLDLNSSFHQQTQPYKGGKGNGGRNMPEPTNGYTSDKTMNIQGSTSGQVYLTKNTTNGVPETTPAKHDDFHSTSSTETSTGDSGHGSDEDMSNSMEQANAPAVAGEQPAGLASRQSAVRASFPLQNRAQRPSLSKSPTRVKNSTVRFDPHVSYDNIPSIRSAPTVVPAQPAVRSPGNSVGANGLNQPYSQHRVPQKYDLLVMQKQQQHAPQHQLYSPHQHMAPHYPSQHRHMENQLVAHLPSQNSKARLASAVFPASPQRAGQYRSPSSMADDLDEDSDLNTTTSGSYSVTSDDVARLSSLSEVKDMFV